MAEKCGDPIFRGKGLYPTGHCGLTKGHIGECVPQSEIDAEAERMATKQLELDLNDVWKSGRDLPDGADPIGGGPWPFPDPIPRNTAQS